MNQMTTTSINDMGVSSSSHGTKIAPQSLGEVVRFAEVMAKADIALPKHLRGNAGACMAVAMQALEWGMSPFAVASKSYAVNGTIAYEAQLIAAVVNTRSGISGRLNYGFAGTGNDLTCTVTGSIDGEVLEYTSPRIGDITTKNSPLWKTDPQQQLGYYSARSWARRHVPEVLLGVYDRDEAETFEPIDITPPKPSIGQRLETARQASTASPTEAEGFSRASVAAESETLSTPIPVAAEAIPEPDTSSPAEEAPSQSTSGVNGDAGAPEIPSQSPALDHAPPDADEIAFMVSIAKRVFAGVGPDQSVVIAVAEGAKDDIGAQRQVVQDKLRTVVKSALSVCQGKTSMDACRSYCAGVIGCEENEIVA